MNYGVHVPVNPSTVWSCILFDNKELKVTLRQKKRLEIYEWFLGTNYWTQISADNIMGSIDSTCAVSHQSARMLLYDSKS